MRIRFWITLALFSAVLWSAPVSFEGIVAVVDGKAILRSDLIEAVYQMKSLPGFAGLSPEDLEKRVLDRLIDDQVILSRARRDTLKANPQEVDQRVDMHIARLQQARKMSMAELEQAVKMQTGMTMAQYREKLKGQVEEQAILQRIQMKYVGRMELTRKEVEEFYNEYKDSLPVQYDVVKVRHIEREIVPARERLDSVYNEAQAVIDMLVDGAAFDSLARTYSQDASATAGGDIGFYRRGNLDPAYERAAWGLPLGQYTQSPVKSRFGYHIIKKLAEKDGEVRSAHILFRTTPSARDSLRAKQLLDSLAGVVQSASAEKKTQTFAGLARQFSADDETRIKGGDLGWFERPQLDTAYHHIITALDEGELSEIHLVSDSWHLFYLEDEEEQRGLTLDDNYSEIEQMATGVLSNRRLQKYVDEWRKETYIDIRTTPEEL